jgi:AraC family transcriptional activator of mtrCDE
MAFRSVEGRCVGRDPISSIRAGSLKRNRWQTGFRQGQMLRIRVWTVNDTESTIDDSASKPSRAVVPQTTLLPPRSSKASRAAPADKIEPPSAVPAFDSLFRALRVKGVVYFAQDFASPWAMRFRQTVHARFHVVLRGQCWIQIAGQTLALKTNDLLLLRGDETHALGEGEQAQAATAPDARDVGAMIRAGTLQQPPGEGSCRLMSGHFEFDPQVRTLLMKSLPMTIKTRARTAANRDLVHALPGFIASEMRAKRPGASVIIERLVEIFLVQVLRTHFEAAQRACAAPASAHSASGASLMAAFFDPRLNAGLNHMHTHCHEPLTLAQVANAAGMSRSAFAQRFKEFTGEMPMAHLAEWRLLRATQLLTDPTLSVAQVAAACGHRSNEGFSRAFKHRHGQSPTLWRAQVAVPG